MTSFQSAASVVYRHRHGSQFATKPARIRNGGISVLCSLSAVYLLSLQTITVFFKVFFAKTNHRLVDVDVIVDVVGVLGEGRLETSSAIPIMACKIETEDTAENRINNNTLFFPEKKGKKQLFHYEEIDPK